MNSDLQYLAKLIEMIDKESDDHSRKKLWSLIGVLAKKETGELSEKEAHRVISEMHELNMEQVIKIQASEFYKTLPLPKEITAVLIQDFIEMEHCRRRDDFEGFALAAFQQLENIVTYFIEKTDVWTRAYASRNEKMFVNIDKEGRIQKRFGTSLGEQIAFTSFGQSKQDAIEDLFKKDKNKIDFTQKFKLVLYFNYFNELVKSFDEWNWMYNTGYDLYLSRNRNHRGSVLTPKQTEKQENINHNKYCYYLLFSGYLADFILSINTNYSTVKKNNTSITNISV